MAAQKFQSSETAWTLTRGDELDRKEEDTDTGMGTGTSVTTPLRAPQTQSGAAQTMQTAQISSNSLPLGGAEDRRLINVSQDMDSMNKKLLQVDTLCAMEAMLDATLDRIANSEDQGLYLQVFGVNITFAILTTVGSALATAVSAGLAQISQAPS